MVLTASLSHPSLGCKAIFLLGGKSREDPPLAMFLRSGDVILMAGEARECFHGKYLQNCSNMEDHCHIIIINCLVRQL